MKIRRLTAALMAVGLAVAMTIGSVAFSFASMAATATVTGGPRVYVRSKADTASMIVGTVSEGDEFEVGEPETGADGEEWYRVTLENGKEGYIRADRLSIADEGAGTEKPAEADGPEAAPLVQTAGQTVSVQYFTAEDAPAAAGTATLVTDRKGNILSAIFYDEDGNFVFRADYDGEAKEDGPTVVYVRDIEDGLTAASVAENIVETMKEAESVAFESRMTFLSGISAQGFTMDMEMNMNINAEMTDDPRAAHILMTYDVNALGESMAEEMEVYALTDSDGTFTTYTRESADGEPGEWDISRDEESELLEGDIYDPAIFEKIADGTLEAELSDEVVNYRGTDCYRLDLVLSGEDLSAMSAVMMGGSSEEGLLDLEGMDADKAEAPVTAFISTEDYTLKGMLMDCTPMAAAMMESMMGMEEEEVSLDVRQFDMEIVYTGFDVDTITAPEE